MATELVALRRRLDAARIACNNYRMANAHGRTLEELVQMDLEQRMAEVDLQNAYAAYNDALDAELRRMVQQPEVNPP